MNENINIILFIGENQGVEGFDHQAYSIRRQGRTTEVRECDVINKRAIFEQLITL